MSFKLRKDPGILTPYRDNNDNNRRIIEKTITFNNAAPSSTIETQTIEILAKNWENETFTTLTTTSARVHFPNTQRARKQDEPYDLSTDGGFTSASGRKYTQAAVNNIKVFTRSTPSTLIDPLSTVADVSAKDNTGVEVFKSKTKTPFRPMPGKRLVDTVASIKLTSPDASNYQYIEIENPDMTIGSATDRQFSISIWFYLNSAKETILLTKGIITQEYELKINSDMKLQFKAYDSVGGRHQIISDSAIETNKWQHVVLSSKGNDWSSPTALTNKFYNLYINKSLDSDYTITCLSYDAAGTRTTGEYVFVGYNDAGADNNFDGLIAEVAMWQDYFLKKKEVVAIYDSATKNRVGMDTSETDAFRQGVSVTTNRYKNSSILYKMSSNNQRNIGRPDHYVEQREFGQPMNYEGNVPFEDIKGRHRPYNLSTKTILSTETVQYPVVYNNNILEPTRYNGVLEPFDIRETVVNNSADSPWQAHRISGDVSGANSSPEFGTIFISNDIKRTEDQLKSGNIMLNADCYFDDSEQAFDPVTNSAFTDASDSVYLRTLEKITFPVPGFSSDVPQTEVLFDDTIDLTTNSLITETESITSTLMALPDSSRSNYLIKSAPSGFTYDNNPEGTDSLAYGGLLRK